jgi:hypothetical protein
MALRDRQTGGIPLTKGQAEILSHIFTVCVPIFGYTIWYPMLGIPEELWPFLAAIGIAIHLGMSLGVINPGYERAQLFNGQYTGVSFPAGIYFNPVIPFPLLLVLIWLISREVYRKIFWSMEGDVRVESITLRGVAEGLTRDGAHVEIEWMLTLEIMNVAVFRSQTRDDTDREALLDIIRAEYSSQVKTSVIEQHTVEQLQRGTHSGGSQVLNQWMTEVWNLVSDFGVRLARSPITKVRILSEQVRQAWERAQAKDIFTASGDALGEAFARFREKNPGLSEEIAWVSFASSQGLPPGTSINIIKVK